MPTAPAEPSQFARILRQHRLACGLTQQELAVRSGVSGRTISDLERGINQRPQRETAIMLADGLALRGADREAFLEDARRPAYDRRPVVLPPLPKLARPLLGRDEELRSIEAVLSDDRVRVLTLSGPGGVGKTSLAIEAANRLADRYHDGVALVRLDGLHDPVLVLSVVSSALQLRDDGSRLDVLERLTAYLDTHDVLIILDNLEHLLDSATDLATLIARVPHVKLLITSRESPRLTGERVLHIEPLPLPDLETDRPSNEASSSGIVPAAVQLFVRGALDRNPQLDIDAASTEGLSNLASIEEICRRLDGLPLAIELAAAQTEVLSPDAILSLLEGAGLPMLESGNRDQPARLQTMNAAIGWSYARLSDDEQALFRALAVFAGGFTLLAAERVAHDDLGLQKHGSGAGDRHPLTSAPSPAFVRMMTSLARQNLVVQDPTTPAVQGPRFRLLEPLRLFALDRLRGAGEEETARRRHAVYFSVAAEALDALTLGSDPELWFDVQARELDNMRAAQDWAFANGDYGLAAHLVAYFAQYWLLRGLHAEGRQRVEAAIAVDAAVDASDRWFLRFWAAIFAFDEGDVASASDYAQELLKIAAAHGDTVGIGAGLTLLSQVAGAVPESREEAVSLARKAVDHLEPLDQDLWLASAWARLGIEYQFLGRFEEARDFYLRGLALRRQSHCEGCTPYSLVLLGSVYADLGQVRESRDAFGECLSLAIKHGNKPLTLRSMLGLADLAWRFGTGHDSARSALLFYGAVEALQLRHGVVWDAAAADVVQRWKCGVRQELGAEAADEAINLGRTLSELAIIEQSHLLGEGLGNSACAVRREGPHLVSALGSIE